MSAFASSSQELLLLHPHRVAARIQRQAMAEPPEDSTDEPGEIADVCD